MTLSVSRGELASAVSDRKSSLEFVRREWRVGKLTVQ